MSEIYKKLSDARRLITPEDTDYDIKSETHTLKSYSSSLNPKNNRFLRIYTDGSTLISQKHKDEKTFSGWGMYIMSFYKGDQKELNREYNFIMDGTPLLAELEAIKRGLEFVDRPSSVSFVCDSTDAIKELGNLGRADEDLSELQKLEPRKRYENPRYRVLQALSKIKSLIDSKNVVACEIKWQPSHTIDKADVTVSELKDSIKLEEDIEKKFFLMDVYGNELADEQAGKGSKKAVKVLMLSLKEGEEKLKAKGAFHYAEEFFGVNKRVSFDEIVKKHGRPTLDIFLKYTKNMAKASKQFHGSRPAKSVAIEFLAANPKDYASQMLWDKLFSEGDQRKISSLIEKREMNSSPTSQKSQGKTRSPSKFEGVASKIDTCDDARDKCLKSNVNAKDWVKNKISPNRPKGNSSEIQRS